MKLTYICLLIIALLALTNSINLRRKKKNTLKTKTKTKTKVVKTKCPNVYMNRVLHDNTETLNYFPEDFYADKDTATTNAKKQSVASRALLTAPKGEVLNQLKIAAEALWNLNVRKFQTSWKDLSNQDLNLIINSKINLQVINGITKNTERGTLNQFQAVIGRVKNGNGTNGDNSAVLGLLGNYGATLFDYINPAKKASIEGNEVAMKILYGIAKFKFPGDRDAALRLLVARATPNYGKLAGPSLVPLKPAERGNCIPANELTNIPPKSNMAPRTGLLNLAVADTSIPPVSWPWQTLPKALMDKCPNEPFIGHFSGSIVELLFMLDLFAWDSSKTEEDQAQPDLYLTQVNKLAGLTSNERKARAALASSFLLGMGMHSAVEVAPTVRYYLGQSPNAVPIRTVDDVTSTFCGQTDYIVGLINDINK